MNQRKPNSSAWYPLGLGVLLCIAVLVISTGTAFARYRTERIQEVSFAVREPEQVLLGNFHTVTPEEETEDIPAGTVVFQPQDILHWENVGGATCLTFVVTNGSSDTDHAQRDQEVQLRLLGTLGLWTGMEPIKMQLTVEDTEQTEELQAVPIQIEAGTALYYTHGSGWVYTFQGEEGELTWKLPGDQFSAIKMVVTLEGVSPQEAALLQPQITARVTE